MCLGIPGKIVQIEKDSQPLMGKVEFGGIGKEVCLELVPDAKIGDYVIVHVGFAISKLDEKEALETIKLLEELEKSDSSAIEQNNREG